MMSNQTECSRLEQNSVIKFLVVKSENHVTFTEEYRMCTEKDVLVIKMFTNELKMSLSQKDSPWSGNTLTLQQRKILATVVSK